MKIRKKILPVAESVSSELERINVKNTSLNVIKMSKDLWKCF